MRLKKHLPDVAIAANLREALPDRLTYILDQPNFDEPFHRKCQDPTHTSTTHNMGGVGSQPIESPEAEDSVFSLSKELQENMIRDYNNEQIVRLFGKQIEKVGERKAEVLRGSLEQRARLKQQMEQFRVQNEQIHKQLDQTVEQLEDRFADAANVVDYDSSRLEKEYLSAQTLENSRDEIPCFTERSNIASCYETKKDPLSCEAYITALSACASKTIT
eukprot:scaffold25626_cov137-Cylindrotheca_fusiformis.AAC.4